ncbi:MAG TPA: NAD(P)/FAD-dependent oxidoreductase [Candidatus Acidoferrales bacterium]
MPSHETVTEQFDAIVIGAGAAGLMCAIEAGKRGRRVAVLEHAERAGKKILISGGGRCNFTNLYCQPEHFISANPHFAKSALARYTPQDFIALVEKHGIAYHEKTLGQLFCDRSSNQITGMLEAECREAGVKIFPGARIKAIRRADSFVVSTAAGEFRASALVIATGGLSIPKMGATAFGYDLARQFGIKIRKTNPGLVPLLLNAKDRKDYCDLAGISAEAQVSANGAQFRESLLITHRGLSGPAILQASSYWQPGEPVHIDLAPAREVFSSLLNDPARNANHARSALQEVLPKRFATRWLELRLPAALSNAAIEELERELHDWTIQPAGTEGYEKAEVTTGGIDTDELSSKTMEAKKVRGLFFIGEVVDVTGHLGGFNFQWAWASGAAAGRAI